MDPLSNATIMSVELANNVVAEEPMQPRKRFSNLRAESLTKLRQVLDYSTSVDKVSDLLGVDAPTVYEIYKEQAEEEINKYMLKNTPRNKRNSLKALDVLGHDLSKEKVKKTLGIDEEVVHQVEEDIIKHQEVLYTTYRMTEASPAKKKCGKALLTLGLDPSIMKATKLLGVDEEVLRDVVHEEQLIQEEKILTKRRQNTLYLHDKKHNRKALHVVGYDPSYQKVLNTLGVQVGTYEEVQVRTNFPSPRASTPSHPGGWWSTPLVYTLSAVVLFSSMTKSL